MQKDTLLPLAVITVSGNILLALLFALVVGIIAGCTVPESKAHRVLAGAGYTEISLGGYAAFACAKDDTLASEFTAKGPHGQRVRGAVCCGVAVKNCTIRLD